MSGYRPVNLEENEFRKFCSENAVHGDQRSVAAGQSRTTRGADAFTLVEMLLSIAVVVLLVLFVTQLVNRAAAIANLGNKHMDADGQARQLFDRMQIDFDQMLKRSDVSYYVKTEGTQVGNDQIAFFSAVPGHYSQSSSYNSKMSLVAYRVNADSTAASYNKLERMGKGLALNGADSLTTPLVFLDNGGNARISAVWPPATNSTATDSDYELAGPQVFRLEYYYLLSGSPSAGTGNQLSAGPWASTNAFIVKDVAAIVAAIAVVDPKSKAVLTTAQMEKVAGTNGQTSLLGDFASGWAPGQLLSTWQAALNSATAIPRDAASSIRLYERYFYLSQ